jgi:hypothetical protein
MLGNFKRQHSFKLVFFDLVSGDLFPEKVDLGIG